MKKVSLIVFLLLFGIVIKGFSQTAKPVEFWAGKWEFTVIGTPQGDSKFKTNLIRKEGKLEGELVTTADGTEMKIPITKIEESADKIAIFFTTQGYDVNLEFTKVDENNIKGSLMSMFDAKGVRIKE
jgi:hypothetical protein